MKENSIEFICLCAPKYEFFDDTIISNITLEDNIDVVDKSKLDFSIKKSGLEKFVNGLEHGLKTNIGELGRISGV